MGFLFRNHQTTKVRKNQVSDVGIANENDLGSLSGLEVAIDKNKSPTEGDETKHFCDRKENQETAKETGKKRNEKPKSIRKVGFLFRRKEKCKGVRLLADTDKSRRPFPTNRDKNYQTNSDGSNDLSVYTSNHTDGLAFTSLHNVAAVQTKRARGGLGSDGFVTMDHVSDLILDLDTAVIVGAKRTIRALKMLLALSSVVPVLPTAQPSLSPPPPLCQASNNSKSIQTIRIEMARAEDGRLIPVLLSFLNRCMAQSKEHTLTLLLLGNLSIPQENKKMIALDCKGAEILAKLLCEDPSSHLVALVLVNLTYDSFSESNTTSVEVTMEESNSSSNIKNKIDVVDHDFDDRESSSVDRSSLRKELLATNGDTALVESLAFALRVSTLTQDEYERRRDTIDDCNYSDDYQSPATKLSILMAKDQQLRSSEREENTPFNQRSQLRRLRVLPATASPEQILRQLRSNEQELQQLGSIDGMVVEGSVRTERRGKKAYRRQEARSHPTTQVCMHPPPIVEKSKQIYPETAKWCLSALRNLTKPCNCDATAAHVLIKSGIFSLIVQCITTLSIDNRSNGSSSSSAKASAGANAIDVTRMGISRMEELSSPTRKPSDNEDFTMNPHIQLDIDFLSASYGKISSQNVTDPRHSTAEAPLNTGCSKDTMEHESEREAVIPLMPSLPLPTSNSPYSWESNSIQDAALSVVLNLSASSRSREYMNEPHIVKILSMIAGYPQLLGRRLRKSASQSNVAITSEEHQTMHFQALKARMALSYLIGSQGHFGQTKLRASASTVHANRANSPLVMSDSNVELLVELLANTMHHRGKEGNRGGNYLSGTFDLKCVILSLRFLLTHTSNQERIAKLLGMELNSILINVLGKYALEPSTHSIDSETSGHVVFSLYLLSTHGFEGLPFLPEMYGPRKYCGRHLHRHPSVTSSNAGEDHGLAANILVSYLRLSNIPPEGRHAARQLLLRLENLDFENKSCTAANNMITRRKIMQKTIRSEDLKIDYILLAKIKRVRIANLKHGSKPDPAIFNRPVLRCHKPCNWDEENHHRLSSGRKQNQIKPKRKIDWSNRSTVSTFSNALIAVQQLSYGSIKIRHSLPESIDDVAIANEIARCCTSNEITGGCYNFLWTWEDDVKSLKKTYDECMHGSSSLSLNTTGRHRLRSTGTRSYEDRDMKLSAPYGLCSIANGNRNIAVETESSTNSNEKFSLLRLCCSSDSADSSSSEIEISSQVEV